MSINVADPFSPEARAVLSQAQVEATNLNHSFIDPGHMLLAVIATDAELAGILAANDVHAERVRDALRTIYSDMESSDEEVGLNSQAKAAVERSVEAVHPVLHPEAGMIEPATLLLGVLAQADGVVADILASFGVDRVRLIDQVTESLAD